MRVGAAAGGRRLVVHAGTPKTGTTTVQRALAALDPALRDRGVHVPMAARIDPGLACHANLRRRFTGFRYLPEKGGWRALVDEIRASDARLFVISDEVYGRIPQHTVVAGIAELAVRCNLAVDVVAYVRPQCQYLDSHYAELVKIGLASIPFEAYAAEAFVGRPVARHRWLSYARAFAPWRAAFSARVAVTPLEPARLPDGLVAHFLGLLGAGDLAGRVRDVRANPRIGARELEVRRLTTVALRRAGVREPWLALERLHRLPELLAGDPPFRGLSASRAADLMARFAASNAAFARDYGISAAGVLFADPAVDGFARANVAQWGDLGAGEQRAVRDYVQETAGVDPAPRPRRGGPAMAGARAAGRRSWLGRIRRRASIGSLGWHAAWFLDWRTVRRLGRALVRRAGNMVAASSRPVDAVFDADGPERARDG